MTFVMIILLFYKSNQSSIRQFKYLNDFKYGLETHEVNATIISFEVVKYCNYKKLFTNFCSQFFDVAFMTILSVTMTEIMQQAVKAFDHIFNVTFPNSKFVWNK